ncbi:hypothetical protein ACTXT7_004519 [Hymenolepis weldensis]
MDNTNHVDPPSNTFSKDAEKSNNIPSPEKPRGTEACESSTLVYQKNQFACIKNSTICNENDTANVESMSAFLPSGYLSPIQHKSSVTFAESIDSESTTDNSASFCRLSNTTEILEQNISNLPYSPIKTELPNSPLKMSTLPEVTEPLSSTFRELSIEPSELERNRATTDIKISSAGEITGPPFITPKQTFKRTARLLLAPYISCEYESSDEDNLECPPEKPPPPIMCMWRTQEQEFDYENTVLSMPVESDNRLNTADKSTQTFVELDVPALYYSPKGDPNAHQLKEWMNKIFDNKFPDLDS